MKNEKLERRQGKSRWVKKDEFKRVIQFQESGRHPKRNIAILYLSFYCGLRVGEIAKLTLQDLVNEDWELRDKADLKKEITKMKKTREIYIVQKELRVVLTKHLEERRKQLTTNEVRGWKKQPVFVSQMGNGFSPKSLQMAFKVMFKKVGLDNMVSSHSGRRSFISNLITQGVDMKSVSTLAGHASIQTTMDTYASKNPIEMERVCKALVFE